MKRLSSLHVCLRAALALSLLAPVIFTASTVSLKAEDTKPAEPSKDAKASAGAKPEKANAEKKTHKLTGAELYAIHCNRCHPERYATEWTAAQWKTLMTHMRVRANLPAVQAKEILKFLQEESGN